jgi:hypothetical protein
LIVAVALVAVAMILTKLFTAVVYYADEPTVQLVLRASPSFTTEIRVSKKGDLRGTYVLFDDENGFVGEELYDFVISVGWWLACIMLAAIAAYWVAVRRSTMPATGQSRQ